MQLQFDFEDSIGYWVCMTARALEQALNDELIPHGITYRQWQVLCWLALKGGVENASFEGITGITLEALAVEIEINRGSATNPALDFTTAFDLDRNGTRGDLLTVGDVPIDFTGERLRAAGAVKLNLFDFVSGAVGFAFEQQKVDVDIDEDGTVGMAGATLTTVGLRIIPDDGEGDDGERARAATKCQGRAMHGNDLLMRRCELELPP